MCELVQPAANGRPFGTLSAWGADGLTGRGLAADLGCAKSRLFSCAHHQEENKPDQRRRNGQHDECRHDALSIKLMREQKIWEGSMSKYCFGIVNLYPRVKMNLFKERLKQLRELAA